MSPEATIGLWVLSFVLCVWGSYSFGRAAGIRWATRRQGRRMVPGEWSD